MTKTNLLSGIGTLTSALATTLSFLYSTGSLQVLLSLLTGAFVTYWFQSMLQDRSEKRFNAKKNYELMREKIYGRLFHQLNWTNADLKQYHAIREPAMNLPKRNHLYFMVPESFRASIEKFYEKVEDYNLLVGIVEGKAKEITGRVIEDELKHFYRRR